MSKKLPVILLVEDNEDDVFALRWAFRKAGVPDGVQVVTDGRQALDYLKGSGEFTDRTVHPLPELMFLDLKLPYYDGYDILQWMRDQPEMGDIRIVILSGSDESRDHERTRELGARDYVVKPLAPDDVRRILAAAVT